MPLGPGKYDDLCTEARLKAKAKGALLIILEGEQGSGFSCQLPPEVAVKIPAILQDLIARIEASLPYEMAEAARRLRRHGTS